MESLALLAAIILLTTLTAGVVSVVIVARRPRRLAGRLIGGTVGLVALAAGANIARLDIGIGARAMGFLTAAAGLGAIAVAVRGRRAAADPGGPSPA